MNILLVTPYLPHPRSGHGTGVMVYGMLRQMAARHAVTLVSFCDARERTLAGDLERLPITVHLVGREKGHGLAGLSRASLAAVRIWQFLGSLVRWEPYFAGKYRSREMRRLIRRLTSAGKFDVAEFEMAQMGSYAGAARGVPRVLHEHDFTFRPAYRNYRRRRPGPAKLAAFLEWCRWASYEKRTAREFSAFICVTEQDTALVRRIIPGTKARYLPRGVDLPEPGSSAAVREPFTLLFVGSFSHAPNADAAAWLVKDIFPLIAKRFPETNLYIIGADPPRSVHRAAADDPRIRVTGFVDDLAAYYRRASVLVAPLRFGGGIKMKILHAMAYGIPVVTTGIGLEGIEGRSPENLPAGDTAGAVAAQVCRLLADPAAAATTGAGGAALVRKYYSWERVAGELERIYQEAAGSGAR
ncbi:MAG TPA: glycosyltransferase family 4 protein [Bacteroidota bacterium]|nr:glycosyltransferase family 4 protein [Bacteroidota bacterium]